MFSINQWFKESRCIFGCESAKFTSISFLHLKVDDWTMSFHNAATFYRVLSYVTYVYVVASRLMPSDLYVFGLTHWQVSLLNKFNCYVMLLHSSVFFAPIILNLLFVNEVAFSFCSVAFLWPSDRLNEIEINSIFFPYAEFYGWTYGTDDDDMQFISNIVLFISVVPHLCSNHNYLIATAKDEDIH